MTFPSGPFYIRNITSPNAVIDVAPPQVPGSRLILKDPIPGKKSQLWEFKNGNIINVELGLCIQGASSTGESGPLTVAEAGGIDQEWGFEKGRLVSEELTDVVFGVKDEASPGQLVITQSAGDNPNQFWELPTSI